MSPITCQQYVSNLSLHQKTNQKNFFYQRCHSEDNISRFKQCLSNVNWAEVLDNIDVDNDYNAFVKEFQESYDECIPLKK